MFTYLQLLQDIESLLIFEVLLVEKIAFCKKGVREVVLRIKLNAL